ncbi:competence protein CoiA family protein [Niallia taxi]|uniref:competence protein CoiA family protein n=1 Tax=Niallia taxi TaxID=2499688 RepID=UPI0015F59D00|nr:competence protein CoiA family protein [Niallia taxi]
MKKAKIKGKVYTLDKTSDINKLRETLKNEEAICIACGKPVRLRAGEEVAPYFAHVRSNPKCKYSVAEEEQQKEEAKVDNEAMNYKWTRGIEAISQDFLEYMLMSPYKQALFGVKLVLKRSLSKKEVLQIRHWLEYNLYYPNEIISVFRDLSDVPTEEVFSKAEGKLYHVSRSASKK